MRVYETIQSTVPFTTEGPVEKALGPSTDDMTNIIASVVSALSLEHENQKKEFHWYKVASIRIDMEQECLRHGGLMGDEDTCPCNPIER